MTQGRDSHGVLVIALGGNAIVRRGDDGTVATQFRRSAEALAPVADLVRSGARVVLTHGNGPVVGAIVLRGELAGSSVPPTPLFIADADSEGGIGLMLQQVLGNLLRARGVDVPVVSLVTQVLVDAHDPAFATPTKPIGPFYDAEHARALAAERGWDVAQVAPDTWRRVVASPRPQQVIEARVVRALLDEGVIPIACGGGGVPVVSEADGTLRGTDAVIDKDRAAALLARSIGADTLAILMEADAVYEDFGTPAARRLAVLTPDEALALAQQVDPGGMRPKLEAAAEFARSGATALICASDSLADALVGRSGTRVAKV